LASLPLASLPLASLPLTRPPAVALPRGRRSGADPLTPI